MFSKLSSQFKIFLVAVTIFVFLVSTVFVNAQTNQNIAQVASNNSDFSTLVSLLTKADLVTAVSGDTKLTVLAPTDEAFAKLPTEVTEALSLPENKDTLVKILKYHVVAGEAKAAQIVNLNEVTTLEGSKVKVNIVDGKVFLNGKTTVVTTDILTSNGVIHAIDSVLVPADVDISKLIISPKSETTTTTDVTHNINDDLVRSGGITINSLFAIIASAIVLFGAISKLSNLIKN